MLDGESTDYASYYYSGKSAIIVRGFNNSLLYKLLLGGLLRVARALIYMLNSSGSCLLILLGGKSCSEFCYCFRVKVAVPRSYEGVFARSINLAVVTCIS